MTTDQQTTDPGAPREGDLTVWFIPAIPGKAFKFPVPSLREARYALEAISLYTLFLEDDVKLMPDTANAGGVSRWESDGDGGFDWYDVDDEELEGGEDR